MPAKSSDNAGLDHQQAVQVLQTISAVLPRIVLVGGQAVNFWAELYRSNEPELAAGPYTSKDIDFQGSRQDAGACARLLGGSAEYPSESEPATELSGKVRFDLDGKPREIDFLNTVLGLKHADVEEGAILVTPDPKLPVLQCKIMHPVDCLISRTSNVAHPSGRYRTEHGLLQLRASIVIARRFIADLAGDPRHRRKALNLTERVFRFALDSDDAAFVYRNYEIEVFDTVQLHAKLGETFATKRFPQMQSELVRKRSKQSR